jgi:hypothetical protein
MAWKKTSGQRFWEKVNRDGPIPEHRPELGPCWIWTGSLQEKGHPQFYADGRRVGAHRYSFLLHGGVLAPGECTLHRCDNPPCVNPAHLFAGTRRDNNHDRHAKGRDARGDKLARAVRYSRIGERNGRAVLSADDVRSIRREYANGLISAAGALHAGRPRSSVSQQQLASRYGVTQVTISGILSRRLWPHLE